MEEINIKIYTLLSERELTCYIQDKIQFYNTPIKYIILNNTNKRRHRFIKNKIVSGNSHSKS